MTDPLNPSGIVGTDGIAPVYDPDQIFRIWAYDQIYLGVEGAGKYVPKVKDWVVDRDTFEEYTVAFIDQTTFVPTLILNVPTIDPGPITGNDILLGAGPRTKRVYLDKSVMPYNLSADARYYIHRVAAKYAKFYTGSEENGDLKVISAIYDPSGNFLDDKIPLELVSIENGQNVATYGIPACKTIADLPNGEQVTVYIFSEQDHVISKDYLLVENSAFIKSIQKGIKYVSHISLESPFISSSDPNLIAYPLNVPTQGLNLIGVVHYSDGSLIRMPVDGTKFKVFGLQWFVATIIGQEIPVVITYELSASEAAYGANVGQTHHISERYVARTVDPKGSYTVKLFGYPVWIDAVNGYRMEWYLYNLERQVSYLVTPWVTFNDNTPAFNPILYGVNQRLSVSINLQDVSGSFSNWIFTQSIDIVLIAPMTNAAPNWSIGFAPGQNPPYGRDVLAEVEFINANLRHVDLSSGATTQDEWLERFYYRTLPLVDTQSESVPPAPDFFALVLGGQEVEFPISQWNSTLVITNQLQDLSTLFIKFYRRLVDTDIQLAIAAAPVHQTN